MAYASVGTLGSNQSKTSTTTVAITTTATAEAGNLVAVVSAWDNTDTVDVDPLNDGRLSCTDSAGNVYTKLAEIVNAQGGAAAGATVAIFAAVLKTQLNSGGTITVTSLNAQTAKAATAWEFTTSAPEFALCGKTIVLNDAADPGAISTPTLPSRQYLLIHGLAGEGPNTDAYTWDGDYTQFDANGSTGSTADTNMHVRGGFRIATLTTDTVDVTSTTADRDYVQALVALCEYTPVAFPTTGVLDSFNRANEDPLAGSWDSLNFDGASPTLEVATNVVGGLDAAASRSSYNAARTGNYEAYATITTKPATSGHVECWLELQSLGSAAWDGYRLFWTVRTGTDCAVIERFANNARSSPVGPYQQREITNGDKFGLRRTGTFLEAWVTVSSVWTLIGVWEEVTLVGGKAGLGTGDTTARMDDFGGGPVASLSPSTRELRRHPMRHLLIR